MKAPRGMERIEQPVENLMEEVARRGFHAIGKIIADGIPSLGSLKSEAWRAPTISRALTDEEAEVAAKIAVWIEAAAKDIVRQLVPASTENQKLLMTLVKDWSAKKTELNKFKKGLTANEGRLKGASANKKKAEENKRAWESIISAKRKDHPEKGKQDIYRFIQKDINDGKHPDIKDSLPSFETAKSWIPARSKKKHATTS